MARNYYFNYVTRGGLTALNSLGGITSRVQGSYPNATVRVDKVGTNTLATLYVSSSGAVDPINPFTASDTGFFDFWTTESNVKLTFSGGGLPNTITIDNIAVGGGGGVSDTVVVADLPTGGDDSAYLQSLIDTYFPLGIEIRLRTGIYFINSELQLGAGLKPGRIIGVPHGLTNGVYTAGTCIRANQAGMRSVLAVLSFHQTIEHVDFDANRLASYGLYFNGAAQLTLFKCYIHDALLDGCHSPLVGLNQSIQLNDCYVQSNGTTYMTAAIAGQYTNGHRTTVAGTAATTNGGAAIVITGGPDLTTVLIRSGSGIRVGSTKATAYYGKILSVTATTITLQPAGFNLPTATLSGQDYAIGIGDGWHEEQSGSNGYNEFNNGSVFRANGNDGITMNALYGSGCRDCNVDFNNFAGISFGTANLAGSVSQCIADHVYMEFNTIDYYFGSCVDVAIREPTDNSDIFSVGGSGFGNSGTITRKGQCESIDFGARVSFVFVIRNNAGTLEGQFVSDYKTGTGVGSNFTRISNALGAFTAMSAINGGAGFGAFGAGIYTTALNLLVFDCVNAQPLILEADLVLESDTTGAGNRISPSMVSVNVNGVTKNRLALRLIDTADAQQNWDTTQIPAGKRLAIRVSPRLK